MAGGVQGFDGVPRLTPTLTLTLTLTRTRNRTLTLVLTLTLTLTLTPTPTLTLTLTLTWQERSCVQAARLKLLVERREMVGKLDGVPYRSPFYN